MKSNAEISENQLLGSISTSSIRNLLPKSISSKQKMNSSRSKPKFNMENSPPVDPNIQADKSTISPPIPKQSPLKAEKSVNEGTRSDNHQQLSARPDPSVQVVVRIRPSIGRDRGGDGTVRKVSDETVSVGDRNFTFDLVLDSNSDQEDVFQSVGVPLVKSALAGYNTSILAYGQTGGGKTYTMWGPPSAMVQSYPEGGRQGIGPRILQMLFSKIQQEQDKEGKRINYQCRCSFLEIYNGQIGDLLDPTQRNLKIKDDAKNGFCVENLTEEYVSSYEDVTQILIKGLSSRKVGVMSINSKSSRSHIMFTCIIQSWCKGTSSKHFGSSKTSRISLVDFAGFERNRLDDAGAQHKKEEKYAKKSIAELGYLVNVLAKRAKSRESVTALYKCSCLTHLLKESLGGNAKLTVICAISPENECRGETISTLRFGQRAKLIQNEPVINEITEDDVNNLGDQIRLLKEELIREKSNVYHLIGSNKGRSARENLNKLRASINRSLILPRIDSDFEEVHVNKDDVRELCLQLDKLNSSYEENMEEISESTGCTQFSSAEGWATTLTSEHYTSCPEDENEETDSETHHRKFLNKNNVASVCDTECSSNMSRTTDNTLNHISISACSQSTVLLEPLLSQSPKIENTIRKSIIFSSSHLGSQANALESSKFNSDVLKQSQKQIDCIRYSPRSSKIFAGPTESLAASLQRGLQIIDYHLQNSASNKSSASFSFDNLTLKPYPAADNANASVQTLPEERLFSDGLSASFLCVPCQQRGVTVSCEIHDILKTWIIAGDEPKTSNELADQVPKNAGEDLAEVIKREKELENICKEQAAKIEQLNHLVEKYKHEKEQISSIKCCNAVHVGELKHEILPTDELKNDLLKVEKQLRWNDTDNHEPEIIKEKCEIREFQEALVHEYGNSSLEMNEKELLVKEIESLRSKLQSRTDASPNGSTGKLRSSCLLSRSIQLRKSGAHSQGNSEEEFEKERKRWMEMESDWISLTDELRIDLESNRQHAEKVEMELRLEKRCTEELDDALKRAVLGHARMVEHYAELQEKYNDLVGKHQSILEGIVEVKRAAVKAGVKGHGSRFAKSLAAELSNLRVDRERERELLKKENRSLRIQLRDTAEAVHAAGELLVRLREAEETASIAEGNLTKVQEENEKLKKQIEKVKRKHKMEMITMNHYLAESRLPEAALRPLYREDSDASNHVTTPLPDDDEAWRAEFGAIYQEHY